MLTLDYLALESGLQATSPEFWVNATDHQLRDIFRPSGRSKEQVPLLETRIELLREAGSILIQVS